MYDDLKGKTAFITGAGKKDGIGFAIAQKLAASGCAIVLSDLDAEIEQVRSLVDELKNGFGVNAIALGLDVTDQGSVNRAVEELVKTVSTVDILINNAGAALGVPSAVHTYDDAAWMKTIDINFHGTYRVSKALLPIMLPVKGTIINMASKAGKVPLAFNGAYACAKAAVITLTKVMAKELAGFGIRVNAICPGLIMTGLQKWRLELEARWFETTPEEREKEMSKQIPLGYFGGPGTVADLAAFLASKESSYITGQAINVDGGQVMEL